MKKTLLAGACVAMMAASFGAQAQSSVTLYGVLDASGGYEHASGGNGRYVAGSQGHVSFNDSFIGLRGSEDLGGGLNAIFQIESSIGSNGSQAPGYSSGFANRNSRVGLQSQQYGTFFFGNWETPYLSLSQSIDPFYGEEGSLHSLLGASGRSAGFAQDSRGFANNSTDAAFNRRQGNSVQYWSPEWYHLQAKLGYSFSDNTNNNGVEYPDGGQHGHVMSASLQWHDQGLSVGYGYERHQDLYGTQALDGGASLAPISAGSSHDEAHKVVVSYDFNNGLRVGGAFERLAYHSDGNAASTGAISDFQRSTLAASADYRFGMNAVRAGYARAFAGGCSAYGAGCDSSGTGASMYSAGYSRYLSKRTELYATYSRIDNGNHARFAQAFGSDMGVNPDATYQYVGVGMRHVF